VTLCDYGFWSYVTVRIMCPRSSLLLVRNKKNIKNLFDTHSTVCMDHVSTVQSTSCKKQKKNKLRVCLILIASY